MTAPNRPSRPQVEPPRDNWLGLLLAAAAAAIIFAGLFFLTQGIFGLVVLVGGGVFAMAALHYVIWGRWLSRVLHEEESVAGPRPDEAPPDAPRQDDLIRRGPRI
jgi:hypothetical protein